MVLKFLEKIRNVKHFGTSEPKISAWSIIWNFIKTLFCLELIIITFWPHRAQSSSFFLRSSAGILYSFRSKKWGCKNVNKILFGKDSKFKECLTYGCQSSHSAKAKNKQFWSIWMWFASQKVGSVMSVRWDSQIRD